MPQQTTLAVRNLRDLNRAFARAPKKLKKEFKGEQRAIAKPIAGLATERSLSQVANMPLSPQWSEMRTGVTQKAVYVAPKQRGRKAGPQKRRKLAPLLLDRAMIPALEQHQAHVARKFDEILATVGRDWER